MLGNVARIDISLNGFDRETDSQRKIPIFISCTSGQFDNNVYLLACGQFGISGFISDRNVCAVVRNGFCVFTVKIEIKTFEQHESVSVVCGAVSCEQSIPVAIQNGHVTVVGNG